MSKPDMSTYPDVFAYRCPHPPCDAPKGQPCRGRGGDPLGGLHKARLDVLGAARGVWPADPTAAVEKVLRRLPRTTYLTVTDDIAQEA